MKAGSVKVDGELLRFTPTEMRLLSYLMLNHGQILSRDSIIEKVLGFDYDGMDHWGKSRGHAVFRRGLHR